MQFSTLWGTYCYELTVDIILLLTDTLYIIKIPLNTCRVAVFSKIRTAHFEIPISHFMLQKYAILVF